MFSFINNFPLSVNLRSTSPALTDQGDTSRQEALKTSISLLNKPLDMALLGKKRDSKSKSPIMGSLSPNTTLEDYKKNKNDVDEGTSGANLRNQPEQCTCCRLVREKRSQKLRE